MGHLLAVPTSESTIKVDKEHWVLLIVGHQQRKAAALRALQWWFAARKKALTELSIEDFGLQPSEECRASPDPQPRTMYTLLERPNHSNFAQCKKCGQNEREMTQAVANRAQRGVRAAIMQQQIWHIAKVNAERAAISEWANDAVRSSRIVFTVDDKCGSH